MKIIAIILLASLYTYGAEVTDYSNWLRVMTDSGTDPTAWAMASGHESWQKKILTIDFDPTEIKQCAVEYELLVQPYDPTLKNHISDKKHPWGNWQVKINGNLVFDEPANPYIYMGVNRIPVPVNALKRGDNLIEIGWRKLTAQEIEAGKRYGYVYFTIDLTDAEKARRKLPISERPDQDPNALWVRLFLELK